MLARCIATKARTPDVLRQVLKLSESDFDREFSAYVEAKARPLHQALSTQNNVVASMTKEEVLKTTRDAGHVCATHSRR